MDLIEGRRGGAVLAEAGTSRRIEAGIEFDTAKAGHAERSPHHIHPSNRLPETHLESDPKLGWTEANRRPTGIRGVFLIKRQQIHAAEPQGHHAAPADVGNGIGESSRAGCRRPCPGRHQQ